MNEVVKEFIEGTIHLLETEQYHEMFTIWYLHYSYDKQHDYQNLLELFQIFDKAGIDLVNKSLSARKDIIQEHMFDYIVDVLDNDPTTKEVTLPDVIRHLNSDLYTSLVDRSHIFKYVGDQLKLRRDDIVVSSFRITRM